MSDVPLIKRFLQHQSEFLAYLIAITRDFDAAEEIFQNAALVIIEKTAQQEPVRDFRAWAKEIVRRQALYYLRESNSVSDRVHAIEPQLLEQITRCFVEDESTEPGQRLEVSALRQCISSVEEHQQKMLNLRYERRASFKEIGELLGKSEGAVQRALCRIRKALHDCVRSKVELAMEK